MSRSSRDTGHSCNSRSRVGHISTRSCPSGCPCRLVSSPKSRRWPLSPWENGVCAFSTASTTGSYCAVSQAVVSTLLLTALASIKRVGDLQTFSVDDSCLKFGPADSRVTLRLRPGYVLRERLMTFLVQIYLITSVERLKQLPFVIRGLVYKMLRRNHPKCDLTIISEICVGVIHRMNVWTEIAHPPLFQMWNLWISNDPKLVRNWMVSALCLGNDS